MVVYDIQYLLLLIHLFLNHYLYLLLFDINNCDFFFVIRKNNCLFLNYYQNNNLKKILNILKFHKIF